MRKILIGFMFLFCFRISAQITPITTGMTPTQFINTVNGNFTYLGNQMGFNPFTTVSVSQYKTAINLNFVILDSLLNRPINQHVIGYGSARYFIPNLNSDFINANTALNYGLSIYINNSGDDTNGIGSRSNPFASLYKACSLILPGSTIHVLAGTYTETQKCNIAVGVNILGVGNTSRIISHYVATSTIDAFLTLSSSGACVDGNQSVKNIKLDGALTGDIAAIVWRRNNVIFDNVTVVDFNVSGVQFRTNNTWDEPTYYATGNQIINSNITNSSTRSEISGQSVFGLFWITGQIGMVIHDNYFDQTGKSSGSNGDIGMLNWVNGLKFYNNICYKSLDEGDNWNFHIELWDSRGGNEVYDNEFHGGCTAIDLGGTSNLKGDYDYSWWVHNNLFSNESLQPYFLNDSYAIAFEGSNEDAIVSYNHVINWGKCVSIGQDLPGTQHLDDNIRIFCNIFENIGFSNRTWGCFLTLAQSISGGTIQNIYFENNVCSGSQCNTGIRVVARNLVQNINITNNVIQNVLYTFGWLDFESYTDIEENIYIPTYQNFYVKNNDIYNNVDSNAIYYYPNISVTNLIQQNNIYTNPLFVSSSDFHLQNSSPSKGVGLYINDIILDYDGVRWNNPPSIGVYEKN